MSAPATAVARREPFALSDERWEALGRHIEVALARARRDGRRAIASVTEPIDPALDLSAAVLASRAPQDRFFCFEQPDRDGYAVCSLGAAAAIEARGPGRFADAAAACRTLASRTVTDDTGSDPGRPAGAGPVFTGGFSFAPDGGSSPAWAGFAPAQLALPEVSFARRGDQARMTVSVAVESDDTAEALLARAAGRVAGLHAAALGLVDPDPVTRPRVAGAAPASHYEEAVRRAVERIRGGGLDKVVLAREVRVHAGSEIDPAPVLGALRTGFAGCYCYCTGGPEGTFLGASPELLVRRDGSRAQTVALAGTTRRSADPSVDAHLGERLRQSAKDRSEHEIVVARIERTLDPVSVWVSAAEEPMLVKVQNVQHLATPIRAQLSHSVSAIELAGRLHPTPAVGGEPTAQALSLIPALEGLDRGWYAGALGWTDLAGDGELCVALRCGLIRGATAHLYAGCGIVADSEPAAELAETEVKLAALLPLLA